MGVNKHFAETGMSSCGYQIKYNGEGLMIFGRYVERAYPPTANNLRSRSMDRRTFLQLSALGLCLPNKHIGAGGLGAI